MKIKGYDSGSEKNKRWSKKDEEPPEEAMTKRGKLKNQAKIAISSPK